MTPTELVAKLRATKSESKRKLLDEAADAIEALLQYLKRTDHCELCDLCRYGQDAAPCIADKAWVECCQCAYDCPCKECRDCSKFEWRGVLKDGAE